MRKWLLALAVLVAAVAVAGCVGSSSGTAYMFGEQVSYRSADDRVTLVFTHPMPGYEDVLRGRVTFIVDKFENVTTIYTYASDGARMTHYGNGTKAWGINYILFMLFPDRYATSTYAGTYFYGGCDVMKYQGEWYVSCTHPIVIYGKTVTDVLTDYVRYDK